MIDYIENGGTSTAHGYWLATKCLNNNISLWSMYIQGNGTITTIFGCDNQDRGCSPLVRLPNTVKAAKYGDTWTFAI